MAWHPMKPETVERRRAARNADTLARKVNLRARLVEGVAHDVARGGDGINAELLAEFDAANPSLAK